MTRVSLLLLLATALAVPAGAQHGANGHGATGRDAQVPSGLSADDVRGLLTGGGLGMARPAELNGYPGPLHVIELAEPLQLTDEQLETAQQLREAMLAEAVPLGRQLVDAEQALDAVFAAGDATEADIEQAVSHAASVHARLRAVQLRTHLAMRDALTDDQLRAYGRLRGHASPAGGHQRRQH
ncbi:MAG: hypothetical protein AAGK21_07850 [Bacteroidota bacterium]